MFHFRRRYDRFCEELQEWASYRGQVLMRTVYGMMYYEQAIKMQVTYYVLTPFKTLYILVYMVICNGVFPAVLGIPRRDEGRRFTPLPGRQSP